MAKLSYQQRKNLPTRSFVFPKRKGSEETSHKGGPAGRGAYPIPDTAHARNALARVSAFGTPTEKATVRKRVYAKYPSIGERKK